MSESRELLLVRYGEIGLKGKNRSHFVSALVKNLQKALERVDCDAEVSHRFGRVYVEWTRGDREAIYGVVASTFGVVSFSPAVRVPLDQEAMCRAAEEAFRSAREGRTVKTFKVEARRSEKAFPLTSMEINRAVGGYVLRRHRDISVDVHDPDVTLNIEVRSEGILIYSRVIPGPGGLPVGTSSKAMLLLSGGIDSPVAGWYALKRGIALEAVHFHSFPFTSERSLQKVRDLCQVLAGYAGPIPIHVVHFTEVQRAIQQQVPSSFRITVMRRFMFRIATALAEARGALALVTGESVGQVASQTLESMRAIGEVTSLPVLRPLVGFDKHEIVTDARRIGSYELSILPYEDCCTIFVPENPQTRPKLERVRKVEEPLDVDALVEEAVGRTELEIIEPPRTFASVL